MQHEILTRHDLLKPDGTLVEAGWSPRPPPALQPGEHPVPEGALQGMALLFRRGRSLRARIFDGQHGGFSPAVGQLHGLPGKPAGQRDGLLPAESSVLSPPRTSWEDVRFQNERAVGEYRYSGRQMALNVRFEDFSGADPARGGAGARVPGGGHLRARLPLRGGAGAVLLLPQGPLHPRERRVSAGRAFLPL